MKYIKKIYLALILIFLYAPIAILIIYSLNESKSRAHFTGFTFKWYIELFKDTEILKALYITVIIAVLSSLFATIIGTLASLGINNLSVRKKNIVLTLNNLPVVTPDIVTGISLMVLYLSIFKIFKGANLELGFFTLLLSHIIFNIPYVILSILPKLKQLDVNLFEAALDLGASPQYALFKIIIPQIKSGIISGSILAFTLSIDDFIISMFTTGSGINNLSTIIYSMTRRGINPKINALSTIMFFVIMILLFFINKIDSNKLSN